MPCEGALEALEALEDGGGAWGDGGPVRGLWRPPYLAPDPSLAPDSDQGAYSDSDPDSDPDSDSCLTQNVKGSTDVDNAIK